MTTHLENRTPVVVLKSDSHGGLNIIRSLGRLGVPVFNIDPNPWAPAFYSRYCRRKFIWDIEHRAAEDSLRFMHEVRRSVGQRAILLPTTDRTACFVADQAQDLESDFYCPGPHGDLVRSLSCKKTMFFLARWNNIPTPDASFPECIEDVLAFAETARFPVMLKGIDGQRLWDRTRKKMFIASSKDELIMRYAAAEDPSNPNLMLQEYIPGGDDTVWMFNGYFNRNSDCLAAYTGKKLRQCPVHTGSTSLGICRPNEIVEATTKTFMKAIGYSGPLDIGFRYDARDDLYKVLDVNPRIGATFRLFVGEDGMDVARALYLDLTGQPVAAVPPRHGRKWIVEDLDIVSSYRYHREGTLSLKEWIESLRGIDEAAFLSWDDPLPVLLMIVHRCLESVDRLLGKLRSVFARRLTLGIREAFGNHRMGSRRAGSHLATPNRP